MHKKMLAKIVSREKVLLQRSMELLRYRRINWKAETNHRIRHAFERFSTEARVQGYLFGLYVRQHDVSNENEDVIQITPDQLLTGVSKAIITHDDELNESVTYSPIIEDGGELVASQSISGHVAFIVHPRKSARIKPMQKELFLFHQLDPTDVTDAVIEKVIRRYILYLRSTSLFGMHDTLSIRERALLIYMRIADIRYRYRISRSLLSMKNEWAKLIVPVLIAWLIGYFSGCTK